MAGIKGKGGVKGRSGGARRNTGPYNQNLHIDKPHAKKLRYLMLSRRDILHNDAITADDTAMWCIDLIYADAWQKDDKMNQRNADIALEGEQ